MQTTASRERQEKIKTKILIVDDEAHFRFFLSWELSAANYEVVTAKNAKEGLAWLDKYDFGLIITDVRMPGGMDGIDFTRQCRQANPSQKIIIVTGYAIEERLTKVLEDKDVLCLRKPFEIGELLKAIEQLS